MGRHAVTLTPDGTRVYSANQQLYLRSMDDMETTPIRGTEGGGRSPFFSPDGDWVGFYSERKLKKVPITGGAPVTLCEADNPYGASWGSDDTILDVRKNRVSQGSWGWLVRTCVSFVGVCPCGANSPGIVSAFRCCSLTSFISSS